MDIFILAACGTVDELRKKAILLSCIGEQALKVINNFPEQDKDTYEHLKASLQNHYADVQNVTIERHVFNTMCQENGENIDEYHTRLRTQAQKCGFKIECTRPVAAARPRDGQQQAQARDVQQPEMETIEHDYTDEMIRDRLVCGIYCGTTKSRLFKEHNLDLVRALEMVRTIEVANAHYRKLTETSNSQTKEVSAIKKSRKKKKAKPQLLVNSSAETPEKVVESSDTKDRSQNVYMCKYCAQKHRPKECPAFGYTCTYCNKSNHFERVCYKRKEIHEASCEADQQLTSTTSDEEATCKLRQSGIDCSLRIDMDLIVCDPVSTNKNYNNLEICTIMKDWIEFISIASVKIACKVDTGAQTNVLCKSVLEVIENMSGNKLNITHSDVMLRAYGGTEIPILGKVNLNCKFNKVLVRAEFIVVPMEAKTIIGLDTCCKLQLVTPGQTDKTECKSENKCVQASLTLPVCNTKIHSHSEHRESQVISTVHKAQSQNGNIDNVSTKSHMLRSDGNSSKYDNMINKYKEVFNEGKLGTIAGWKYKLRLDEDAEPVVHPVRSVPFTIRDKVCEELKRMEKLGVIEKVDCPTEWVSSMAIVEKPGGKVRICLDPTDLNQYVKREHTYLPTPEEILSRIGEAKYFSKLDAKDGYWQVPLTKQSSYLTTFNTPKGRYRYLRLPFGLASSNEVFQKRMTQSFEEIEGVIVMFDDILVTGKNKEDHDRNLEKVLQRAKEVGVRLNKKKSKFDVDKVLYIGHIISKEGIEPDPEKISAIMNMPKPTDVKGIQRLLGMLAFLSKYIPKMSQMTQPLRMLLNAGVEFEWSHEQEKAYKDIKTILTSKQVLAHYNNNLEVELYADASKDGMGACLQQEERPVAYASRSMTEGEKAWSQMEKELLAVVFACERFEQYIYGKQVKVYTDHKPLVAMLKKAIYKNPARVQRLLVRLRKFDLTLIYKPGKSMHIPDTLSRACVDNKDMDNKMTDLEQECELMVHTVACNWNCSELFKNKIKSETDQDNCLKIVKQYVENKWPDNIHSCLDSARPFYSMKHELNMYDGMIIYNDRIVIPETLIPEMLERIHASHQGRSRCKNAARRFVYWKNMNKDIDKIVDKCEPCLLERNLPPKQPLQPHAVPDRAFQKVGVDIFQIDGEKYQLVVDYFSKWVEVGKLPHNPATRDVVRHMKTVFCRFGIPEFLFTDRDSLYKSEEFKMFVKKYEMSKDFSSARFPQSNGQVERSVQHVKKLIRKCKRDNSDLQLALLDYRNTPLSSELDSPAKLLLNRNLRTLIPCLPAVLEGNDGKYRKLLEKRQVVAKQCYDKTAIVRNQFFKPGDCVVFKENLDSKSWLKGMILTKVSPRSYDIIKENGRIVNRDAQMILPDKTSTQGFTVIPEDQLLPSHSNKALSRSPLLDPQTERPTSSVLESRNDYEKAPRRSRRLADKARLNYKE